MQATLAHNPCSLNYLIISLVPELPKLSFALVKGLPHPPGFTLLHKTGK